MTVEQLKSVLHAQPFQPFTIHMGDGRAFFVKHPNFIARSPSGRTVIVYADDESHSILDMLLVTELEVHPTQKSGSAAGPYRHLHQARRKTAARHHRA